jgi:predicted ATPase
MWISSFSIDNYKSFFHASDLYFEKGFNILIGKNNAGKTALLECLSLSLNGKPHRSLHSIKTRATPYNRISRLSFTIKTTGKELKETLLSKENRFRIAHSDPGPAPTGVAGNKFLGDLFNRDNIELRFKSLAHEDTEVNHVAAVIPSHGLYTAARNGSDYLMYQVVTTPDRTSFNVYDAESIASHGATAEVGEVALAIKKSQIYRFDAQRVSYTKHAYGAETNLTPNSSNLPQVLHTLQSNNPHRFKRLNDLVRIVFPTIKQVVVRNVDNGQVEVLIWNVDPDTERDDLAIPLADSGTGIGQVLSMLYVVITADYPTTILIDEPNSFLHPSAAKSHRNIREGVFSASVHLFYSRCRNYSSSQSEDGLLATV